MQTYQATEFKSTPRATSCELPQASLDLILRDGRPVIRVVLWAEDGSYSVVRWVEGEGWDLLGAALSIVAAATGGPS